MTSGLDTSSAEPRVWNPNSAEPADKPDVIDNKGRRWSHDGTTWVCGDVRRGWEEIFWTASVLFEITRDDTERTS